MQHVFFKSHCIVSHCNFIMTSIEGSAGAATCAAAFGLPNTDYFGSHIVANCMQYNQMITGS